MARSNVSLLPMYPLSRTDDPERACESASALPHQVADEVVSVLEANGPPAWRPLVPPI